MTIQPGDLVRFINDPARVRRDYLQGHAGRAGLVLAVALDESEERTLDYHWELPEQWLPLTLVYTYTIVGPLWARIEHVEPDPRPRCVHEGVILYNTGRNRENIYSMYACNECERVYLPNAR